MNPGSRRLFLKKFFYSAVAAVLQSGPLSSLIRSTAAGLKRQTLPADTPMDSLINKNPRYLDTRNLRPIPLDQFGSMGLSDHAVDIEDWRLEVAEKAEPSRVFNYWDILKLPVVQKDVLLICPGVFANFGRWKGISITEFLKIDQADPGSAFITVYGPDEKSKRFPASDILSNAVFLAYEINGQMLPRRHGYPLRAVAEGYFGFDWIKAVHRIGIDKL